MICVTTQVDSRDSFENVSSKWVAEIAENCPGVKVVLAALKCDLRKDEDMNDNPNAITFDQGLNKAKEIGAVKYLGMIHASKHLRYMHVTSSSLTPVAYVECSAVQNRGIRETFYEAAKVALEVKPSGSKGGRDQCIIL